MVYYHTFYHCKSHFRTVHRQYTNLFVWKFITWQESILGNENSLNNHHHRNGNIKELISQKTAFLFSRWNNPLQNKQQGGKSCHRTSSSYFLMRWWWCAHYTSLHTLFYNASSQQSVLDMSLHWHITLIPSQSVLLFFLNTASLA